MFVGAEYYTQHPQEPSIAFEEMPLQKFAAFVGKAAISNADRAAEAIAKADSYSWQIAHPEFQPTAENARLINHWLQTQGITKPTYPDYDAAYEAFKDSGLLDIDAAEVARDKKAPRTFTGVLTKQTFYSLDDLIAAERQAALSQVITVSDEETALYQLPIEQAQTLLKDAERAAQQLVKSSEVQDNADAWLLLHKEFVDDTHNAKLMTAQLRANGVTDATPAELEKAAQQLRASGLVKLKQSELDKQHAAELQKRANHAAKSLFDTTTEEDMYHLPLEEVRRRANGNFSGRD